MTDLLLQATAIERHIFVFSMVAAIIYLIFQFINILDTP